MLKIIWVKFWGIQYVKHTNRIVKVYTENIKHVVLLWLVQSQRIKKISTGLGKKVDPTDKRK